ncbi:MAG TPA: hypothetical protein VMV77_21715 [Bacteroidales bacterium]|nr:hypothetical protein [Bacteroidales bacterium]
MKYNLNDQHWQQFEIFAFRCLQKIVSSGVRFLEGGNDKGRDIIYEGQSKEFQPSWSGSWIFQVKHKSYKDAEQKQNHQSLLNDLNNELEKVFIKNKSTFTNYILVTNLVITPDINDRAEIVFNAFCKNNKVEVKNFSIIGYRHLESCIDQNIDLKWSFPNLISHPDFELLCRTILDSIIQNRNLGWFRTISKYRPYFIYTNFYEKAYRKLFDSHAILLTGPPKSGKTFNAEILVFNFKGEHDFNPLKIDSPDEIEQFYKKELSQIFFCDDAFGSHKLSYVSADEWDRKIEGILALADDKHKFIFTSREHVYNAFQRYANNFNEKHLEKIVVNNERLSPGEKSALFDKYINLSNLSVQTKNFLLGFEKDIINHDKFSPETLRSFFANLSEQRDSKYLVHQQLISHLNTPDEYLTNLFFQLDVSKRIILLAVLCSHNSELLDIGNSYTNLCNDLGSSKIDSYKSILTELDGGILKTNQTDNYFQVKYYHPSMKEGLIKIIKDDENGTIHNAVIKNLNLDLLDNCYFDSPNTQKDNKSIGIKSHDIDSLSISISRLIINNDFQFHHIVILIKWFTLKNNSLLKVLDKPFYSAIKRIILEYVDYLKSDKFYLKYKNEHITKWADLLWYLKSLSISYAINLESLYCEYWTNLLVERKLDEDYWKLVFRLSNYVPEDTIIQEVGRDWLNNFYKELRSQLYKLGYEIYGSEFPNFPTYNSLTKEQKLKYSNDQKLKHKPNRTWYPRFLLSKEKYMILKDIKGNKIGRNILLKIEKEFEVLLRISDYASNRHTFNEEQKWW